MIVVVPAHNEEIRIGRCLEALAEAADMVAVPVRMLVVCDDCRDDTALVCASASVATMAVDVRSVGAARRAGVAELLRGEAHPASVWLANTDADSVVPPTWLRDQLHLADLGADAVAGTVTLGSEHRPRLVRAFADDYRRRMRSDGTHRHVHGANLGVRASAYLDVGGFEPLGNHEDRNLVERLHERGHNVVRPDWITVRTSGRLSGRCTGGFAATLSRL